MSELSDTGQRGSGAQALPSSFRDPSGFLFERDGVLYRQVDASFAASYDTFVDSGLCKTLIAKGLLVDHDEVGLELAAAPGAHKVLRPERLAFISYPYEWAPAQLRDAALLTLEIQQIALEHGMSLRDASAYNVQFRRGRAVFIDTLSFEPVREGEPWVAYHQFCRQFLAPLALMTKVDVRLGKLQMTDVAGVPLDLASELLPSGTRLSPGLLTHLHMHAKSQNTAEVSVVDEGGSARKASFSQAALVGLVNSLRKAVTKLTWDAGKTTWSDYYADASHYSDAAMTHKERLVAGHIDALTPRRVWDLGANTGRFSRLATERGAHTVAFDIDQGAVEAAWRHIVADGLPPGDGDLLPLVLDLANPSPGLGWANTERDGLRDRGGADLILALALVHHLAIGNNVPLPRLAALLADLAEHVVIEWVPKEDPKVKVLLATREDVFTDYTRDGFEAAFTPHFEIVAADSVEDSTRSLYRLRRT